MMQTDVYVLTHNRPEYLFCCLDSLSKNTTMEHRVFVVDNGSETTRNQEIVRMFEMGRKVVDGSLRLDYNALDARDRLMACYEPTGKYVVMLDDDVLVPRGWLESLVAMMEERPDFGVLSLNVSEIDRPDGRNPLVHKMWVDDVNGECPQWRDEHGRLSLIWSPKHDLGDVVETECVGILHITRIGLYKSIGRFVCDSWYCAQVRSVGMRVGYLKTVSMRHLGLNDYTDYPGYRPLKDKYVDDVCKIQ